MSLLSKAGGAYAVVNITANDTQLEKVLENSKITLKNFGDFAIRFGAKLAGIGAAMTLPFKQAAQVFAQFDDAMRTVGAVTNATGQAFEDLTSRAKELGATTSFSAQQVADGKAYLAELKDSTLSP